jgi:hypothetical protein
MIRLLLILGLALGHAAGQAQPRLSAADAYERMQAVLKGSSALQVLRYQPACGECGNDEISFTRAKSLGQAADVPHDTQKKLRALLAARSSYFLELHQACRQDFATSAILATAKDTSVLLVVFPNCSNLRVLSNDGSLDHVLNMPASFESLQALLN